MATWVGYPRWYAKGRSRPVQYVVIHATQGAEGPTSAEDGAAYDKRRPDSVSTHIFVDSNSAVREVPDADRAFHARFHGNEIGLGVELCGLSQQTSAQWHDTNSWPMIQLAAREVAQMCRDHDIPPVRLSVAQVRAAYYAPAGSRPKGICAHDDVSKAYPEDGGTHWDPGPNFPWTEFLAMIADELEDDMATPQEIAAAVWGFKLGSSGPSAAVAQQSTYQYTKAMLTTWPAKLDEILAAALDDGQVDVQLTPEMVAILQELRDAMVTEDEVRAVVDEELDEQARAGADVDP